MTGNRFARHRVATGAVVAAVVVTVLDLAGTFIYRLAPHWNAAGYQRVAARFLRVFHRPANG